MWLHTSTYLLRADNLAPCLYLPQNFRDKDSEIRHLLKQNKTQMMQSEHALLEFKSQVEANSTKVFSDMKQQVSMIIIIV